MVGLHLYLAVYVQKTAVAVAAGGVPGHVRSYGECSCCWWCCVLHYKLVNCCLIVYCVAAGKVKHVAAVAVVVASLEMLQTDFGSD